MAALVKSRQLGASLCQINPEGPTICWPTATAPRNIFFIHAAMRFVRSTDISGNSPGWLLSRHFFQTEFGRRAPTTSWNICSP